MDFDIESISDMGLCLCFVEFCWIMYNGIMDIFVVNDLGIRIAYDLDNGVLMACM